MCLPRLKSQQKSKIKNRRIIYEKFICALLSLAMLALFAGCRDQKNIETDTTDASSGSVEAQVEDTSAASPDSTVPQTDSESASIEETKQMRLRTEQQPPRQNSRLFLPASLLIKDKRATFCDPIPKARYGQELSAMHTYCSETPLTQTSGVKKAESTSFTAPSLRENIPCGATATGNSMTMERS